MSKGSCNEVIVIGQEPTRDGIPRDHVEIVAEKVWLTTLLAGYR